MRSMLGQSPETLGGRFSLNKDLGASGSPPPPRGAPFLPGSPRWLTLLSGLLKEICSRSMASIMARMDTKMFW